MRSVHILGTDSKHPAAITVNDADLDRKSAGFRGVPMAADWAPMAIQPFSDDPRHPGRLTGDFPSFGGVPVFSARAARELGDLLEGRGELLPLLSDHGEFYAFNVTRLSDALDEHHSVFARFSDGGVMDIDTYQFIPDRLAGETIFKLSQIPEMYEYVTDTFVDRVRERGLEGFRFAEIWPHPNPERPWWA